MIAAARAKPGKLSYGHAGNGTSPHLAGELLKYMAKVDITPVPYKGGAPTLNDLLGGHIPMSFNNIPESIAQVKAGAVRPLGVTTAARSPVLPDVPTHRGRRPAGLRHRRVVGLSCARGTSGCVKDKLAKDCAEVAKLPSREGAHAPARRHRRSARRPDEFAKLIHDEYEKWGPVHQGRRHPAAVIAAK